MNNEQTEQNEPATSANFSAYTAPVDKPTLWKRFSALPEGIWKRFSSLPEGIHIFLFCFVFFIAGTFGVLGFELTEMYLPLVASFAAFRVLCITCTVLFYGMSIMPLVLLFGKLASSEKATFRG